MHEKKTIICVLLVLVALNVYAQTITIDEAIQLTATEVGQRFRGGLNISDIPRTHNESIDAIADEFRHQSNRNIQIAILNFSSNWQEISNYVIDELNNAIFKEGSFTVVERQRLDIIRHEQNFQMSGEVSDESAQSIGKLLGAQVVLTGSFTEIGNTYRFRIQAIIVETGVVQYSNSLTVRNDNILNALIPQQQQIPTREPRERQRSEIFADYSFFNGLTLFGLTHSTEKPIGFSVGLYGVYTSFGFNRNNWGSNTRSRYTTIDYDRHYIDQRFQIIDWVLGYNITLIPNILYLPIGVGMEAVKEWRLIPPNSNSIVWLPTRWYPAPQWETTYLFEAGLLFRVKTPINFAPYLFGTYRNIGNNKHGFSAGFGGSFDFIAN